MCMDADIQGGIPLLCAQVFPMQINEGLIHNHAKPDEGGCCGAGCIVIQTLCRCEKSLLQDIVRFQPSSERFGEAEVDHPPEALTLTRKQIGQRLLIAAAQSLFEVLDD